MAIGRPDITQRLQQLIEIGIALTGERDLSVLRERIVTEARRFTGAEAGTLFLRDGAELTFGVTVSVGLATLPEDVTESGELAPAADRALYVAKRLGRNAVEVA